MVRLVNNDDSPEVCTQLLHQAATVNCVDRGEQMLVLLWRVVPIEQLAKSRLTKHLPEGGKRLREDLRLMRNEQKFRRRTFFIFEAQIVKSRDDGFPGSRRGNQQVPASAKPAFSGQAIQHFLLIGLGLQIKPGLNGDDVAVGSSALFFSASTLLSQCARQGLPVLRIVGVIRLKFPVIPERFEIRDGRRKKRRPAGLCKFHRPFDAANQCRFRQVGAADKSRSKVGSPVENPRFGVQPRSAPIERNTQFNTGQFCKRIDSTNLRRADVGGGENPKFRLGLTVCIKRRHLRQHIEQFAHAAPRDEADQDIHAVHVA